MIQSTDGSLYTGITTDIERRWAEHNGVVNGASKAVNKVVHKGAKFFRGRKPHSVVFVSRQIDRSSATKMEMQIKKSKRMDKIKLMYSRQNEVIQLRINLRNNNIET